MPLTPQQKEILNGNNEEKNEVSNFRIHWDSIANALIQEEYDDAVVHASMMLEELKELRAKKHPGVKW